MNAINGSAQNGPFGETVTNQFGRDAIIMKPVKGVAKRFGPPMKAGEHAIGLPNPDFTTSKRIHERRVGEVPYRTTPRQYAVPEHLLVPEDPRGSRVCMDNAVRTGNTANERMDFERGLLPPQALHCPTQVNPRVGQLTKGFSVRYTSTC